MCGTQSLPNCLLLHAIIIINILLRLYTYVIVSFITSSLSSHLITAIMMASIVSPCSPPVKPKNELREEHEEEEEEERVFPMNVESSSIYATLETKDLWKQFDDLSTEMIVTRRGR